MTLFKKRMLRRLRERNRRFNKLNINQQRIRIFEDVLKFLNTGKFKATPNTYVQIASKYTKRSKDTPLDELLEDASTCQVCGIGSAFVSAVLLDNKVKLGEVLNKSSIETVQNDGFMRGYLHKWVSREQLGLIEAAFECNKHFATRAGTGFDEASKAENSYRHLKPKQRLQEICKNIIANEGVFMPPGCENTICKSNELS